jgi:3',5'-cyclic AMP phosphodiesterase CpdA
LFRLAHVTDPHFRGFAGARPVDFLGKRAVGAMNLLLRRRRKHRMELLEAVGVDLRSRSVDHLALTGDLANVSLEAEWEAAERWLEAYGAGPDAVTVIPGNHDAYVPEVVQSRAFERRFARYQTSDLKGDRPDGVTYPFVRLRGEVALIGVTTSVATGDLGAWGEVGADQLGRLEAVLASPEVASRVRVVLLHHPPVVHRPPENRNLRDRAALVALLARAGADLVLHGHDHRDEQVRLPGPGGATIPVVGAGSASYAGRAERRSRYNVYEIEGRSIVMLTYAHDEGLDGYREVRRERLAGS